MRRMRLVIHGKAAANEALRSAAGEFRSAGNQLDVRVTWERGHAATFAREAAEQGCDVVIAAGGDGTIGEVTQGLLAARASQTALAVLPLGTANDFARLIGVPTDDPLAALQLAASGPRTSIDVGLVNDLPFINVASGGFGAEVTARTPPELKENLGGAAYSITALLSAPDLKPYPCRLLVGDQNHDLSVTLLAVGNGRFAGGGYDVAPQARLNDGLLDLTLVPAVAFSELPALVAELFQIDSADNEHVLYRQLPAFELQFEEETALNLDGEPTRGRAFRFSVLPGRLQVVAPAAAQP